MSDTHSKEHILPLRVYLTVGALLLCLTALTVWVAHFQLGEWNVIVAMAVAATKAILVAFFFMHLFYDNKLYFVIFASSLAFVAIFIVLTMYDTTRRDEIYDFKAHPIDPKAIIYQNPPDTAGKAVPASVSPTQNPADTVGGAGH